jgi:hypothetical protein
MQWRGDRDLKATWHECERSDWLIWLLINFKCDDRTLRLIACAMVRRTPIGDGRTVWDLLTDERSRNAVEVAERHANGLATDEESAAARDAAWAAAWAAAWDAARDAAWAAAWDAARDAARDAAWAAAWDAARDAASAAQCDIIREMVDFDTVQQLWEERNGQ